jgi:transcriptional regulator with XRE-family HTH domain
MELFAKMVRERAAELGLSQAEIARRCGISERRFGHYMSDRSEPNLQVLIKISEVLNSSPNALLGVEAKPTNGRKQDERSRINGRIAAACAAMDEASLPLALTLVEAILAHRNS